MSAAFPLADGELRLRRAEHAESALTVLAFVGPRGGPRAHVTLDVNQTSELARALEHGGLVGGQDGRLAVLIDGNQRLLLFDMGERAHGHRRPNHTWLAATLEQASWKILRWALPTPARAYALSA